MTKLEIVLQCIFIYIVIANAISPISLAIADELGWVKDQWIYPGNYKKLDLIKMMVVHAAIFEFCAIIFCLPSLLFCAILLAIFVINACTPMPKFESKEN